MGLMTYFLNCLVSKFSSKTRLNNHKIKELMTLEVEVFINNEGNWNVHASNLVVDV